MIYEKELKILIDEIIKIKKELKLNNKGLVDLVEEAKLQALDIILSEDDFKYVLKRDNSVEKYSPEKTFYSISNAAEAIKEPMNKSDIEWVIKDMEKLFEKREIISSTEIRTQIKELLMKNGYVSVAKNYN